MKEAKFLAGSFFDFEIPTNKLYLFKYFRSLLETQFLRYYFCFSETKNFSAHTGFVCQNRWLRILEKRLKLLLEYHNYCKVNFDLENLAKIEMGDIKFKEMKNAMAHK